MPLFIEKYANFFKDIFKFKFSKIFKDIKELNQIIKLEKAFGYIEIKGPDLHNFYIYFSAPLTTGIETTKCGELKYGLKLFKDLKIRDAGNLRELIDFISSEPFYLNFNNKKKEGKYFIKESFFECGKPEKDFGFDCNQIRNIEK